MKTMGQCGCGCGCGCGGKGKGKGQGSGPGALANGKVQTSTAAKVRGEMGVGPKGRPELGLRDVKKA
ncbi:MAG: hypothetical protein Q4A71_01920 [Actinomycetaceae bacterium]|nr:hypothetical protein [Actinomycetaceae bacterium]